MVPKKLYYKALVALEEAAKARSYEIFVVRVEDLPAGWPPRDKKDLPLSAVVAFVAITLDEKMKPLGLFVPNVPVRLLNLSAEYQYLHDLPSQVALIDIHTAGDTNTLMHELLHLLQWIAAEHGVVAGYRSAVELDPKIASPWRAPKHAAHHPDREVEFKPNALSTALPIADIAEGYLRRGLDLNESISYAMRASRARLPSGPTNRAAYADYVRTVFRLVEAECRRRGWRQGHTHMRRDRIPNPRIPRYDDIESHANRTAEALTLLREAAFKIDAMATLRAEKIFRLENENKDVRKLLAGAIKVREDLTAERDKLNQELEQVRRELKREKTDYGLLSMEVDRLSRGTDALRAQAKKATDELARLQEDASSDRVKYQSQIAFLETEKRDLQKQIDRLTAEIKSVQTQGVTIYRSAAPPAGKARDEALRAQGKRK